MSDKRGYLIALDDDPTVAPLIEKCTGLPTHLYTSVGQLKNDLARRDPIAVFVDIHLGDESGLDLIPELKRQWPYRPIVVLTSDGEESAVVRALSIGADDFLTKPFSAGEIRARLQARLLGVAQLQNKEQIRMGDLVMDRKYRTLKGRKGTRSLSESSLRLLECLWNAKGTLVPKDALMSEGWGDTHVSQSALDKRMHELRAVLAELSSEVALRNVYGEGFLLIREEPKRKEDDMKAEPKAAPAELRQVLDEAPEDLFDRKKLGILSELGADDGGSFLGEIATLFLSELPPMFSELRAIVAAKDAERTRRVGHRAKGICLNVGAKTLADVFSQLEDLGRSGNLASAPLALERAAKDYDRVCAYIRRLTQAGH